ncbi:MAG: amino acid permease [Legionellales bacterium]|nr:amino acid permease [Legionellales bacterium]
MSIAKKRVLSVFSLVMITVTSVDSVRNLPAASLFGSQIIAYFLIAAILFLIPTALISAELSTALPKQGGVYIWVKTAFGDRAGFLAIWFQWIENVIWYPTILSFIAGTLAYLINPHLADNRYFIITIVLLAFWGATILNLFGMRLSAKFSEWCGIFGLILPMLLIIGLGLSWLILGKPLQVTLNYHTMLPDFSQSGVVVALTGIILAFCGMEITTVYAQEVENPQRDYPKALFISTLILISTLTLGSLAIAMVIPKNQISLVAGLIEAFEDFFVAYHAAWLVPCVAAMLILGGMGSVSNWIMAPCKGLLVAAKDNHLPQWLAKENRYGAPTSLLISQAVITTLFTMVFLLLPGVNASYWLLTALAAQLYMVMYLLMFATGIYIKFLRPDLKPSFQIPGGKWTHTLISTLGIFTCLLTIALGFFPPDTLNVGSLARYDEIIIISLIIMILLPLALFRRKKN